VTQPRESPFDDKTRQRLTAFLEFAEMADRLVARGHQAWEDDEFLRLAGEAVLHRIGESVARLDDEFKGMHPSVRWRAMKGMRNLIAHEYGVVDHAIVWNALKRELPRDKAEVQRILDGG
jgi:uncharacterized protein with HEPN domain